MACGGFSRSASLPPSPVQACPFAGGRTAFLGVSPQHSGKSRRRHPGKYPTTSAVRPCRSQAFAPRSHQIGGDVALGRVGLPASVRQTTAMSPKVWPVPFHNMSIDTDPNLQEAASPQAVVVRSFSR